MVRWKVFKALLSAERKKKDNKKRFLKSFTISYFLRRGGGSFFHLDRVGKFCQKQSCANSNMPGGGGRRGGEDGKMAHITYSLPKKK